MTLKQLKVDLLEKLNISPQALSQQRKKLKKEFPMTNDDATCIIAHRNGIQIDKYLDTGVVDKIRDLHIRTTPSTKIIPKSVATQKTDKAVKPRILKIGEDIEFNDPVLPNKKIKEATEMALVFPILYVLENSIREFIKITMTKLYGKNWWDLKAPTPLKDKVVKHKKKDNKDSWHQRRGSHPIDYLDLIDLPKLVSKMEQLITPDIIPSYEWFRQLVNEVYQSRCVVCHMNPLEEINIKSVQVKLYRWQKQIEGKEDLISKLPLQI